MRKWMQSVNDSEDDKEREKLGGKHRRMDKEEEDGCGWKRGKHENNEEAKAGPHEKKLEWRRCKLCGGGSDGQPLISVEHNKHENDDDGFGDEDGWLGHLLGPINDHNAIPRIWLHYQCAIWSPEVHLTESGSLKNVEAALKRGKSLKCTHCKKPGATLGCRVEKCQKTYHLACARTSACKFDHKQFLMACSDHWHIFVQHGADLNSDQVKTNFKVGSQSTNDAGKKAGKQIGSEEEEGDLGKYKIEPTFIGGTHIKRVEESEKLAMGGWESVAGLQNVIECLKEVVVLPLLYPEFFHGHGITPPRGVLLHGYPGTGKTHVVRALVGSCARGNKRIAYFSRKGADCLGKYVGDSEKHLKKLFQVAEESQPSIIFFDEMDGLAPSRTGQQDQTHNSVVSTLLALLDGLKSRGSVVVIGATNRPNAIDSALRRPGRFDREIYFPLPSLEDRISILSLYTQKWPRTLESNQPLLQWIAKKTSGFAGADLQALCTQTAITALKRSFPLKQVLSASKTTCHPHPTQLPVVVVQDRDWLEALSTCPPPCSRREASVARNETVSIPLPFHLIPYLIRPLSTLLVSLYMELSVSLPNDLFKAASIIKSVIVSALERKKMASNKWWLYVDDFIQDTEIANEIEREWQGSETNILENYSSANLDKFTSKEEEEEEEDTSTTNHGNSNQTSFDLGNSSGFRMMIAGNPRCGQRHLASCILNSFVEHVVIRKVDLATITQGYTTLGQGIAHTFANCLSRESCLIFMPRIDSWAIESHDGQTLEYDTQPSEDQCTSTATVLTASFAWAVFMHQVESFSHSTPFIFLATSEIPFLQLPREIRQFFGNYLSNSKMLGARGHKMPQFAIQIDDGMSNYNLLINQSATKLSNDVVKLLVLLIHQKNHVENISVCNNNPPCDLIEEQAPKDKESISEDKEPKATNSTTYMEDTNLHLAIPIFGNKILQNPQYSYLCWVTSKFKEGPSTNVSKSQWEGWKFNSCALQPSSHSDEVDTEENYGVVKGLVAVGLCATRGVYTSLQEVCLDVRAVLTVLVEKVNAKVATGKDRLQYIGLLSHVASLEDHFDSWVYELQSKLKQDSLKMGMPKHGTFANTDPSRLSTNVCSVNCCLDCLNILHTVTKEIFMHEFRSKKFDWSIESIDDTVMSMSVKLLTAVRKLFVDEKGNYSFDGIERQENYQKLLESYDLASCNCKISRNMMFMPLECSCHSPKKSWSLEGKDSHLTELKVNSKFILSNGILVDRDPREETSFHCKFERLCLSSLIQLMVMIWNGFS